jgi:hypothetical protein
MKPPRRHSRQRDFLAAIAVAIPAMLIGSGLSAPPAQAGYVVTLTQSGSNVVATGSGSIDTTGWSPEPNTTSVTEITPSFADVETGPPNTSVSLYSLSTSTTLNGPPDFGSGGLTDASSGSGDFAGLDAGSLPPDLYLPLSYSGASLMSSAT